MFGRKPKSDRNSRRAAQRQIKGRRGTTIKYPKEYTVKEFKKFSPDVQQVLTNRYAVTLTDHKTKGEKLKKFGKSVKGITLTSSLDKIDRGAKKFDKGMRSFDMGLREIDRTFTKKSSKSKYDLGGLASF